MRLFHFSDRSDIRSFEPRPVAVPSARKPGMEWLNGALVWAIDAWHQPLYLFPRDCPRILVWANEGSTAEDRAAWCAAGSRMTAYIERESAEAVSQGRVYRYELPPAPFEALDDAGMWIARSTVEPTSLELIDDLPRALAAEHVELRILSSLAPLRAVWSTTVHASGIRLRNARSWS